MSSAFKNVLMHCSVCVCLQKWPLSIHLQPLGMKVLPLSLQSLKKKAFIYLNAAFTLYNLQPLDGQS